MGRWEGEKMRRADFEKGREGFMIYDLGFTIYDLGFTIGATGRRGRMSDGATRRRENQMGRVSPVVLLNYESKSPAHF